MPNSCCVQSTVRDGSTRRRSESDPATKRRPENVRRCCWADCGPCRLPNADSSQRLRPSAPTANSFSRSVDSECRNSRNGAHRGILAGHLTETSSSDRYQRARSSRRGHGMSRGPARQRPQIGSMKRQRAKYSTIGEPRSTSSAARRKTSRSVLTARKDSPRSQERSGGLQPATARTIALGVAG